MWVLPWFWFNSPGDSRQLLQRAGPSLTMKASKVRVLKQHGVGDAIDSTPNGFVTTAKKESVTGHMGDWAIK